MAFGRKNDSGHCAKPAVALKKDDDRYIQPSDVYARELVNSSIEFATVTITEHLPDGEYPEYLVDPPEFMRSGWRWNEEIDVAMHPHYGALICGTVSAYKGPLLVEELDEERERLDLQREKLVDALESYPAFPDQEFEVPPIGLFILMVNADKRRWPQDWDHDEVWLCGVDELYSLTGAMIGAMMRSVELHEGPVGDFGPRFVATMRMVGTHYQSALERLLMAGLL
jgi:hypothetical protein